MEPVQWWSQFIGALSPAQELQHRPLTIAASCHKIKTTPCLMAINPPLSRPVVRWWSRLKALFELKVTLLRYVRNCFLTSTLADGSRGTDLQAMYTATVLNTGTAVYRKIWYWYAVLTKARQYFLVYPAPASFRASRSVHDRMMAERTTGHRWWR